MKKILIVTGSNYTNQVYQAFFDVKALGHKLYLLSDGSFEPKEGVFEQHFTYDLRKTAEVLQYMKNQNIAFDAVTIKTSEWLTPLTALLAKQYGCIGNDPLVAFNCRSKYHMRQALAKDNIPIPKFALCKNYQELLAGIKKIGIPCVAKPVGGNASYGTFLIQNEKDLETLEEKYQKSINYLKVKALKDDVFAFSEEEMDLIGVQEKVDMVNDYLVEEFMEGPEISVDALVQNGEVSILGIADQVRMSPPYFIQLEEYMPYICSPQQNNEIETLIKKTITAMGIKNSATHTEIIISKDGLKIVEIACRMGGDNIHDSVYQTTGYNLMFENIMIALGEKRTHQNINKGHSAMKYLLPEKAGKIVKIEIPKDLYDKFEITEVEISANEGDSVAPPPHSFDFLGYISTKGATPEEAKDNLKKAVESIKIEII